LVRRLALALGIGAACLIGAALLYIVAINVFFATPLFDRVVNGKPLTIQVHYDRGWSFWPGRIHAENLSILSRDTNIELILQIDEVDFDVSFAGLARRRFLASHVRGSGVSLRVRSRIDAGEITPDKVADLPAIDGQRRIPLRPFEKDGLDVWSDAEYRLWTIRLTDVVAENVREVWVDHNRFAGDAVVVGGFYLKPVRSASVGPVHATIRTGTLGRGTSSVLASFAGGAVVSVDSFDPRVAHGRDILQLLSVDLNLLGNCPDVGRLPLELPQGALAKGKARVDVFDIHVRDGSLRERSRLVAEVPKLTLTRGRDEATGDMALDARVTRPDARDRLDFRAELRGLVLDDALARAPSVIARGSSRDLDLDAPLRDAQLAVEIERFEVPDLARLSAVVPPSSLELRGGRAVASAQVEFAVRARHATGRVDVQGGDVDLRGPSVTARGDAVVHTSFAAGFGPGRARIDRLDVELDAPRLAVHYRDVGAAGDLRVSAHVGSLPLEDRGGDAGGGSLQLELRNAQVREGSGLTSSAWSGVVALSEATIRAGSDPRLAGMISLEATDADPFVAVLGLPGLPRALGLTHMPQLAARARLSLGRHRLALRDIAARGGDLAFRGMYASVAAGHRGAFVLEKGPLSFGLHIDKGGVGVQFFGLNNWSESERNAIEQWLDEQRTGVASPQGDEHD
jgi:hypothetical protein